MSEELTSLTIPQVLRERVTRTPDSKALVAPGGFSLTYRELSRRVEKLTASLRAIGVKRDDVIAIGMPNGPANALAFLASISAGVSAPLNPAYTEAEFSYMVEDLRAKAVIALAGSDSVAAKVARAQEIPLIELSSNLQICCELPTDARADLKHDVSVRPEDIALKLYTSGTTAKPKRVPLSHHNVLSSAINIIRSLRLAPDDRCLNVMPLYHIHGLVGALLSSLVVGSSIALVPPFDPISIWCWFKELQPTWYTAVPTIHRAIIDGVAANHEIARTHSLRLIRSSSAALPDALRTELEKIFNVPVIEAYGMTETAHQIASDPLPPQKHRTRSVGKAGGPEVAIVDPTGALLRAGEIGEIVVRGANVTSGYEQNAAASEASFTRGWFRTGDEGYLDDDGYLFITGRLKDLINRGGEKIAPAEIDAVLLEHPDVSDAATFAWPHATLGEDVAAAVVPQGKRKLDEASIRDWLTGRLALPKIPSRILIVDQVPKSSTGKLQRATLAQHFLGQLRGATTMPNGAVESKLAEIYAQVLGVDQVSADETFFALGGDSVRAFQVIARVRAIFDVNLSIATIFTKPTVAELARVICDIKDGAEPA